MHWMRMSFDRQMRACKSSRSSRAPGTRAAVLAWLSAIDYELRDLVSAANQPAEETVRSISGVSSKPLRVSRGATRK
jgi:hypothetical protein